MKVRYRDILLAIFLFGVAGWVVVHEMRKVGRESQPDTIVTAPSPTPAPDSVIPSHTSAAPDIDPLLVPRPSPAPTPDLEAAMRDLKAGQPLPGLPSLDLPVFLKKGSLVCVSSGALVNPNTQMTIAARACIISPDDVLVSVLPPSAEDANEYLRDHMLHIIEIVWDSGQVSNARMGNGWVGISRLRN